MWGLVLRSLFASSVGGAAAHYITGGKSTDKLLEGGKNSIKDALNNASNFDPSKIDKEDMAEWGGAMGGALLAYKLSGFTDNYMARIFMCVIGAVLGWMGGSALVSPSKSQEHPAPDSSTTLKPTPLAPGQG